MKKTTEKKQNLILEVINKIKNEVEEAKIPREKMIEELKMMNLKIKPVIGDLFQVVKKQGVFLESLWKISKIDEILSFYLDRLSRREKEILFQYLENFKHQVESVNLGFSHKPSSEDITVLEVQLFKKSPVNKKNLN